MDTLEDVNFEIECSSNSEAVDYAWEIINTGKSYADKKYDGCDLDDVYIYRWCYLINKIGSENRYMKDIIKKTPSDALNKNFALKASEVPPTYINIGGLSKKNKKYLFKSLAGKIDKKVFKKFNIPEPSCDWDRQVLGWNVDISKIR